MTEITSKYTAEQLARQEYRKQKKNLRRVAKETRAAAKMDEVIIVSTDGRVPRAFKRGQHGSFVFPLEKREEVVARFPLASFFKATVDWKEDTYFCAADEKHRLFKRPARLDLLDAV